jgi:hypothetical protein
VNCASCPLAGNGEICNGQHGTCNDGANGDGTCTCTPPYSGPVCDNPQLANVNPSTGPTAGGFTITILGNEFGSSEGTVTFTTSGAPVVVSSFVAWTTSSVTLTVPALAPPANGISQVSVTSAAAKTSNTVDFNFAAPTVASVSPNTAPVTDPVVITVTGSSFGPSGSGSVILRAVGGADTTITAGNIVSWGHSLITFNSAAGADAFDVIVQRGTISNVATSSTRVNRAAPVVTSTNPAGLQTLGSAAGGVGPLTVNGQNFGSNAGLLTVTISGTACTSVTIINDG